MSKIIHASSLIDALKGSGILPDNCRRVVIDLNTDDATKLYFECFGDDRLIEILTPKNFVEIKEHD